MNTSLIIWGLIKMVYIAMVAILAFYNPTNKFACIFRFDNKFEINTRTIRFMCVVMRDREYSRNVRLNLNNFWHCFFFSNIFFEILIVFAINKIYKLIS